jgi:O-antigen ligase
MALYIILAIFIIIEGRLLERTFNSPAAKSWYTWPQLALLFLSLIFLSSRMEILVFLTTLTALMGWWILRKGKWKVPLAIAIAVPLLSLSLISVNTVNKERFTEMVDLEADYTENKWGGRSIRIEKWKNAIECWIDSPLIGVGSGDTMDELMKVYERNEFDLAIDNYFNPHNQYLQVAITFGIIGLLYLLWIFWQLFWLGLRKQDWLLIVFTLTMTLSIVTESMFERQKGAVFFVFFAVLLSSRALSRVEEEIQDASKD